MWLLDRLAEEQINRSRQRGEFENLPGAGRPLWLDENPLVPEEMRSAYRMLKNAGYLPLELDLRRQISSVEQLMNLAQDGEEKAHHSRRLRLLLLRLNQAGPALENLKTQQDYFEQLNARLAGGKK